MKTCFMLSFSIERMYPNYKHCGNTGIVNIIKNTEMKLHQKLKFVKNHFALVNFGYQNLFNNGCPNVVFSVGGIIVRYGWKFKPTL